MQAIFDLLKTTLLNSSETPSVNIINVFTQLNILVKKNTGLINKDSQPQLTELFVEKLSVEQDDICISLQKETQRILEQLRYKRGNFWVYKKKTWLIIKNTNTFFESEKILYLLSQLLISVDHIAIKKIQDVLIPLSDELPVALKGLVAHVNTQPKNITLDTVKSQLKRSIPLPLFFIKESNAYSTELALLYKKLLKSTSLFDMSILLNQHYPLKRQRISEESIIKFSTEQEPKTTLSLTQIQPNCSML